jgi:hypothetical protein
MRDFKGMKRQRGRNRKPGGGNGGNANNANPNRSWDSQGPENIKVRGNAQTVYERYLQLARDAAASGDRVLGENYLQHAEHYFRVLRALQPARPVSEIAARELSNQGFDIDFEDESGAQAAAIMAAHAAEQARLNQQGSSENGESQPREPRENQNRDTQNRDGQNRDGQQPREWRDRNENRDRSENRDRNNDPRDRAPREDREQRAETEQPRADGQPRETRRERWERRNAERDARRLAEDGEAAEAEAPAVEAAAETAAVERPARKPRAERPVRDTARDDDAPAALPGFLTRSTAPAAATDAEDAPKPKRAPRKPKALVEE